MIYIQRGKLFFKKTVDGEVTTNVKDFGTFIKNIKLNENGLPEEVITDFVDVIRKYQKSLT